jgi:hypothetical protein
LISLLGIVVLINNVLKYLYLFIDVSQVKKPTEKRKLPSPPIKIHHGKQDRSGKKEDKNGRKENQSAGKKNANGRVENRGQAKTGVNKTARQLIQEFEERRSRGDL